jgi:cell division initiation protein
MDLTPQDILSFKFNSKLKGYDKDEVNNLLIQIAESFEELLLKKERRNEEVSKLKAKITSKEKDERILRETLISAQKFSNDIKKNAEKECEMLIKDAEIKAEEIINEAMLKTKEIKDAIKNLKFKRKELENDIIKMLHSLQELIKSYRKEDEDFEKIEYMK